MPFGLAVGYAQVTVPFVLGARGLEVVTIAGVSTIAQWPHAWKILWAPALDTGWKRRNWFYGAVIAAALFLALTTFIPPDQNRHFGPLSLLAIYTITLAAAQAAAATSSAAVDTLMAVTLPNEKKGAAAGWSMAGNLGGTGVGGAVALWLVQHCKPATTGMVLAGICVACAIPAMFVHEEPLKRTPRPGETHEPAMFARLTGAVADALKDVWKSLKSREGWTGLLICLTPVGTGAATQLFSAVAKDYHAGEFDVEAVNGIFGGIVSALGCLVGGYLADHVNRRLLYVLAGAAASVVGIVMALAPVDATFTISMFGWTHEFPVTFTLGCLSYNFANGVGYAAFAAFVLEMVGHGAGVTAKYQLFVAASNQAISYMTWVDGIGYDFGKKHWAGELWGGRVGLFGADVLGTMIGICVIGAMTLYVRKRPVVEAIEREAA